MKRDEEIYSVVEYMEIRKVFIIMFWQFSLQVFRSLCQSPHGNVGTSTWPLGSHVTCTSTRLSFRTISVLEGVGGEIFAFTPVKNEFLVFFVVTCSVVVRYQRFGGLCCFHLQGWSNTSKTRSQPFTLWAG